MEYDIQCLMIEDDRQLRRCFEVFSYLRPHLTEDEFVSRVRVQQREGYNIVYVELAGKVVAAAGYRIAHFLTWGRVLYIDDLITHPDKKRQGLGGALLDWLIDQSQQRGCEEVHLDTGHQRHAAHRLYLNKGFTLSAHHMSLSTQRG